jgi:tricorn protease-like protein
MIFNLWEYTDIPRQPNWFEKLFGIKPGFQNNGSKIAKITIRFDFKPFATVDLYRYQKESGFMKRIQLMLEDIAKFLGKNPDELEVKITNVKNEILGNY